MKILIADDNNDKVNKLLEALHSMNIARDDVTVTFTIFDTKKALREDLFDLLILDVLIPVRAGVTPTEAGTIDLLTELSSRNSLKKPRQIIGFTAFDSALQAAGPSFAGKTWTVVKFSHESDSWKPQIEACVRYLQESASQVSARSYKTDLCLITALADPEYEALMRLPWNWGVSEPLDDNTFVRRGRFTSGGNTYSVTAAHATRMGMVAAALLTSKLIEHEVPRFVVMGGICAGIKGKANLGDVIVADPAWDWQSGKHFVGEEGPGFAIAPDPIGLSSFVRARFDQMRAKTELFRDVRSRWPSPPDTELKLRIGQMASGSSVLADPAVVTPIVGQHRNLTAVEMEAYGVVAAASSASHPRPTAFISKAVCDFADNQKNDAHQAYAAYCSAQTIRFFFEEAMSEIVSLAGT